MTVNRNKKCHFKLDLESMYMCGTQKKKAAMFGLDARVALAIFGALSIITTAALYSVLEKADAVALVTSMSEAGKAFEQYYVDTRKVPPRYNTSSSLVANYYVFKSKHLVEKPAGVRNWKGPYLQYSLYSGPVTSTDLPSYLDFPFSAVSNLVMTYVQLDDTLAFGGNANGWMDAPCKTAGRACSIWVDVWGFKDENLIKAADKIVDGSDGKAAGDFRWNYFSGCACYAAYFRSTSFKNPNG